MEHRHIHMVTGAFGFSGKYISKELLARGCKVATLTNSPHRKSELADRITVHPYHFDRPDQLAASLRNVTTLYNTYWVRFNHSRFSHQDAIDNTLTLFRAAQEAGVQRIVHTSITNPSSDSELEYFRGKAMLENALAESGISYCILRPAVIFGHEDILINNIAWLLRRLPLFPVFGYGSYRIQPIHVNDFARLAADQGATTEVSIINAIGPETYSFRALVEKIGDIIGVSRPLVSVSPGIGYLAGAVISRLVKDVIVTREEIAGLMSDLLCVDTEPTGTTRLSQWAWTNRELLGQRYASELARRMDRHIAYV